MVLNIPKLHFFFFFRYSLEIADGLGPTQGKVFRIGLMGNNSRPEIVDLILNVLKESLEQTHDFHKKKSVF